MKRLCIVPCGARKVWDEHPEAGPTPAGKAYTGPFASKCREYAQKFFPGDWCVLSAKYGFLRPEDDVPGPYNTSFNKPDSGPLGVVALKRQAQEGGLLEVEEVVVLGGKNYVRISETVFRGRRVIAPLSGCRGIGVRMARLKQAIERGQEI